MLIDILTINKLHLILLYDRRTYFTIVRNIHDIKYSRLEAPKVANGIELTVVQS